MFAWRSLDPSRLGYLLKVLSDRIHGTDAAAVKSIDYGTPKTGNVRRAPRNGRDDA